jgi:hypothetical protein
VVRVSLALRQEALSERSARTDFLDVDGGVSAYAGLELLKVSVGLLVEPLRMPLDRPGIIPRTAMMMPIMPEAPESPQASW